MSSDRRPFLEVLGQQEPVRQLDEAGVAFVDAGNELRALDLEVYRGVVLVVNGRRRQVALAAAARWSRAFGR